jgi:hypothetical protein
MRFSMSKATKLNSSALLLIGAIGGGLVAPQLMTGPDESINPSPAFDMMSKRVVVEAVIGATDGLLSTGWENPAIETRVDALRTDEHRVDIDAYEAVRTRSFEEAVDGQWTEEALNAYLGALELDSGHLFPIVIMSATSQRPVSDLIAKNHDWMTSKPSELLGLSRLLDLETEIQGSAASMSEEEVWFSDPPLSVQAYASFSPPLHDGFFARMDPQPAPVAERSPIPIPQLSDFYQVDVGDPFGPQPKPAPDLGQDPY